jgi:hypothetical protein
MLSERIVFGSIAQALRIESWERAGAFGSVEDEDLLDILLRPYSTIWYDVSELHQNALLE